MPAKRTCNCMTCPKCQAREKARTVYRLRAYGQWQPHGDIDAVRAHLELLRRHRVGIKRIHELTGVSRNTTYRIRAGKATRVSRAVADALLSVSPDATLRVNPIGTARRIQALMVMGYTTYDLAARIGKTQANLWELSKARVWVTRETHDRVAALFTALCMTPGPSVETRRRALAAGHLPPLAWDDIDDENETPTVRAADNHRRTDDIDEAVIVRVLAGEVLDTTRAEKEEIMARWVAAGGSQLDLCARMGWKHGRYTDRIRRDDGQAA